MCVFFPCTTKAYHRLTFMNIKVFGSALSIAWKTFTTYGNSLQLRSISVCNTIIMIHILTAQEVIVSFLTNTYRVSVPSLARRCLVEFRCHLWHGCKFTNCVHYGILARTENLHFAVNDQFMRNWSQGSLLLLLIWHWLLSFLTFSNRICFTPPGAPLRTWMIPCGCRSQGQDKFHLQGIWPACRCLGMTFQTFQAQILPIGHSPKWQLMPDRFQSH